MTLRLITSLLACVLLVGCRAPTEIEVTLRTDLPCTDAAHWKGVDVYVGAPGASLENTEPTFHTDECNAAGLIGSVIVVPSDENDARVGVRVVASTLDAPDKCREAGYEGCVVARRSLRFRPHQTLPLDIDLKGQCVRVPCDAASTCVAGTCVGTDEVAPTEPELPDPPPEDKRVRCGDDGVFCPTSGNVCCLTADVPNQKTHGECKPSSECQDPSTVLFCDDTSDCAPLQDDDGSPALCFLTYTNAENAWTNPDMVTRAACVRVGDHKDLDTNVGLALCEDRRDCPRTSDNSLECRASRPGVPGNVLPGYHWCELSPED